MPKKMLTGWRGFDRLTGGFRPGTLTFLVGSPGVGKSSFALSLVDRLITKRAGSAAYFSLEMKKEEIAKRTLFHASGIDIDENPFDGSKEKWERLRDAAKALGEAHVWIDDTPGHSVGEIERRCEDVIRQRKRLDLVVIDYLQLMERHGGEWGFVSRRLKFLAKKMKFALIVIVGGAPLSGKNGALKKLRELGGLDADADVCVLLSRPPLKLGGLMELRVEKSRGGAFGNSFVQCDAFRCGVLLGEERESNLFKAKRDV